MSLPLSVPSLSIVAGRATEVGRRRHNNEDAARCDVFAARTKWESTLLMVSDGVGGAKAGEVASRMAVDHMHEAIADRLARETPPENRGEWLDAAMREADQRIRSTGTQPGFTGMGATLSILWLAGQDAWWGQAGDSRIYLFRGGELRQITHDQSPVGRMRAAGKLTEEEARTHAYRHVIDQCLGGDGHELKPETGHLTVEPGDIFLLCSDGLSDGLWDREIAEGLKLAADNHSPEEVARTLVARANDAGGKDNITAVVARAEAKKPATQ